jgi:hypothetical protein
MSVERVHHCDGPECQHHARVLAVLGRAPVGFMTVTAHEEPDLHFCGWECVLRYAAQIEPDLVIGPDQGGG